MTKHAWIVFDLGFGDAGKGATVDFLVRDRRADLVVRFNGGAQAGHNVVTPDGRQHTFSQFGSGTFVPGTRTLLGPEFVMHPGALVFEAARLSAGGVDDAFERTSVDEAALVISPFQQAGGRLRELNRGSQAHGTCGIGFGETVQDALSGFADTLRARDLRDVDQVAAKLESQRQRKFENFGQRNLNDDPVAADELSLLRDRESVDRTMQLWRQLEGRLNVVAANESRRMIQAAAEVVFEGAQGVLLDQDVGFHPHTTWSDCTPWGAISLLGDVHHEIHRIGVFRAYMVRHGRGPFPTADPLFLHPASEPHNDSYGWQGPFRRGPLDLVLLRYALDCAGGADGLAITCLDIVPGGISMCRAYELDGKNLSQLPRPRPGDHRALSELGDNLQRVRPAIETVDRREFLTAIEAALGVPVCLVANGPTCEDRRWQV